MCAGTVCTEQFLSACLHLLQLTLTQVQVSGGGQGSASGQTEPFQAPKWLSPLLLLLDIWEKTLAISEWTKPVSKVGWRSQHLCIVNGWFCIDRTVMWCGSGLTTLAGAPTQLT